MLVFFAGAVVGGGKPGPGVGWGEAGDLEREWLGGGVAFGGAGDDGCGARVERGGRGKDGGGEPLSESRTAVAHK